MRYCVENFCQAGIGKGGVMGWNIVIDRVTLRVREVVDATKSTVMLWYQTQWGGDEVGSRSDPGNSPIRKV